MDIQVIKSVVSKSITSQIKFPQVVQTLLAEGVKTYHVDLIRNENRYYGAKSESHLEPVELKHGLPGAVFKAQGVADAVAAVQRGEINYLQFLDKILSAGCVYYIVYLEGRKVCYSGEKGEVHTEYFPN